MTMSEIENWGVGERVIWGSWIASFPCLPVGKVAMTGVGELVTWGVGVLYAMTGVVVSVIGALISWELEGGTLFSLFSRFTLFSLYHNSRLSSPLAKNAFTMSDGIPCHSSFPLRATDSAGENVFFDHASRSFSISHLLIAYLCLDCSMIFFVCSPDHSGVGSGIVFIEKGSEVMPLIIILV